MTQADQLAYCDHLQDRLEALNAKAAAFLDQPEVWCIPHPYEDAPPMEWDRVAKASIAMGFAIGCFATFIALIKA